MKPTELMINDWVHIPMLDDDTENYVCYSQVRQLHDCDLDCYAFKELKYEEVKPIPLTPEILEKNGFTEDYRYDNLSYIQSCGAVTGVHIKGENGLMEEMYFKYVHEVQNALRLCGLYDLADSFKLEE